MRVLFLTRGLLRKSKQDENCWLDGNLVSWLQEIMKTTLDIPEDLLRAMKMRAVQEGRKFKDVAEDVFRCGLAQLGPFASRAARHQVKLPLIQCQHPAPPATELTPDKVADILLKQELESLHEDFRWSLPTRHSPSSRG